MKIVLIVIFTQMLPGSNFVSKTEVEVSGYKSMGQCEQDKEHAKKYYSQFKGIKLSALTCTQVGSM